MAASTGRGAAHRHSVSPVAMEAAVIARAGLNALIGDPRARGYTVIGPRVRSEAIVYDEVIPVEELPGTGSTSRTAAPTACGPTAARLFAHMVGHDSLKRHPFPPVVRTWHARRGVDGALEVQPPAPPPPYAFLGVPLARAADRCSTATDGR
jgi:sulfhydrogenase subunit beta (sulfur reductase)